MSLQIANQNRLKPFLRWAGGKNWLLCHLKKYLPDEINNYYEPFLGGGAVYFYLYSLGLIKNKAHLSDINKDLINCFKQIKNHVNEVIKYLKLYDNTPECYYKLRKKISKNKIESAAIFIYLNRTSFNGIYRVNKNGEYNVPFGNKKYKQLFDFDNLFSISESLANCKLYVRDFSSCIEGITKSDFIFLDPPYTVAHNKNGFIKYNQNLFSLEDQFRLSELLKVVQNKDANYVLTNANHKNIKKIFGHSDNRVVLNRMSVISGKTSSRKMVSELLFKNY